MKKVLLVENDKFSVELVKRLIVNICDLDIAIDFESAISKINETHYDAILLDINLGIGPNGLDVLKKLREIDKYKNTPVIAMTAYAMQTEKDKILSAGVNYYLVKPINIAEFQKLLSNVLS